MQNAAITIHRGTHQIGGICTEISCGGERVLIDLGANLPDYASEMSDEELLSKVFDGRKTDSLLFTHPHGDHYGLFKKVPADVPMYIGSLAKEILKIIASHADYVSTEKATPVIERMLEYKAKEQIPDFKHIKITPYYTDHSAPGAHMFYIEAAGKKILYTGDFRVHGIIGQNDRLIKVLKKYIPNNIDILITEGTTLSRKNAACAHLSEKQLGEQAAEIFNKSKYNFIIVSSINTDTIMEFYRNTPKELEFVCDAYQAEILIAVMRERADYKEYRSSPNHRIIRIIGGKKSKIFSLNEKAKQLSSYLRFKSIKDEELEEKGFVMLVRANSNPDKKSDFEKLRDKFYPSGGQIIYSMWDGYLKPPHDKRLLEFIGGRDIVKLHTSGHADAKSIANVIETVNPKIIIPMHTERAEEFSKIPEFATFAERVRVLKDGELFNLADI